jgi:Protein of unknown function (DUF3631)
MSSNGAVNPHPGGTAIPCPACGAHLLGDCGWKNHPDLHPGTQPDECLASTEAMPTGVDAPADKDGLAHTRTGASTEELGVVLDDIAGCVRQFVVMSDVQAYTIALWILHTHAIAAASITPYLNIHSAEKRCGKTRVLDLLELLVAKPWRAVTPTEAVLFRKVDLSCPTLLLDEVDAIYGPKASNHEGLRALLNAGFNRGTTVPRCVGEGSRMRVQDFKVFCPKAFAGIGNLPDTVADRSIGIRLERKHTDEPVKRFRRREVEAPAALLKKRAAECAVQHLDELRDAYPDLPEIDDRAADAWEPLLAIADAASPCWSERARRAALALSGGEAREDDSFGIKLLADCKRVFDSQSVDRIATTDLIDALAADEEAPWADWYGTGHIKPRSLAKLLRRYKILSGSVRFTEEMTLKGYKRDQFEDAWRRYLAPYPSHPSHPSNHADSSHISIRHNDTLVADSGQGANPHEQSAVADVTDKTPGQGAEAASADDPGRERMLDDVLVDLLTEKSVHCPVCGEHVLHDASAVWCPECEMTLRSTNDLKADAA